MAYGHLVRTAIAVLAGAAPFLALQVIFDLGVTGRPFKTPYVQYLERYQPGSTFGSTPRDHIPVAALPQKQAYLYWLVHDEQANRQLGWRRWIGERFKETCVNALPNVLFLMLLPVGLLGLGNNQRHDSATPGRSDPGPQLAGHTSKQRWVVAATIPLFFGLYLLNPFYLAHYPVPVAAPLAFLAALGLHVILTWLRGDHPDDPSARTIASRWRNIPTASLLAVFVVLCVRSLPELNSSISDEPYPLPTVTLAQGQLREAVRAPAVILFRYRVGLSPDDEPVYNSDVVWPDNAAVIRAHDLGQRNAELFRYYGDRQPARRFYLFDRGDNALYDLGTAQQALRPEVLNGQLGQPIRKFGPDDSGP